MKHFEVSCRCQENPKKYVEQTLIKQRTLLVAQENGPSRVLIFPNKRIIVAAYSLPHCKRNLV
jgi:hypothetical protein